MSSLIFNYPTCVPSVFLVLSGRISGPFCGWAITSQHRINSRKSFSRSPPEVSYDFEHLVSYQFKSVPFSLNDSFITFILHGNLSKLLLLLLLEQLDIFRTNKGIGFFLQSHKISKIWWRKDGIQLFNLLWGCTHRPHGCVLFEQRRLLLLSKIESWGLLFSKLDKMHRVYLALAEMITQIFPRVF